MYVYATEESGHTLRAAKSNFSELSVSRILIALLYWYLAQEQKLRILSKTSDIYFLAKINMLAVYNLHIPPQSLRT